MDKFRLFAEKSDVVNSHPNQFETFSFLHNDEENSPYGGLRTKGDFKMSYDTNPLISVITVVYNGEKFLEETIKSVINQTYDNVEYLIIDGGSTDGTLDIIKKYEGRIDYWVSKPDKGIYDAINKGIQLSRGKIIGILNADDYYYRDALSIVAKYFINTNIDYLFGSVIKNQLRSKFTPWKIFYSFDFYSTHSVGFFVKRSVHEDIGLYSLKYACSADYDFFYKLIVKYKHFNGRKTNKDEIIGIFRPIGFSTKLKYLEHLIEETLIRVDNGQNRLLILMLFVLKYIKNLQRI